MTETNENLESVIAASRNAYKQIQTDYSAEQTASLSGIELFKLHESTMGKFLNGTLPTLSSFAKDYLALAADDAELVSGVATLGMYGLIFRDKVVSAYITKYPGGVSDEQRKALRNDDLCHDKLDNASRVTELVPPTTCQYVDKHSGQTWNSNRACYLVAQNYSDFAMIRHLCWYSHVVNMEDSLASFEKESVSLVANLKEFRETFNTASDNVKYHEDKLQLAKGELANFSTLTDLRDRLKQAEVAEKAAITEQDKAEQELKDTTVLFQSKKATIAQLQDGDAKVTAAKLALDEAKALKAKLEEEMATISEEQSAGCDAAIEKVNQAQAQYDNAVKRMTRIKQELDTVVARQDVVKEQITKLKPALKQATIYYREHENARAVASSWSDKEAVIFDQNVIAKELVAASSKGEVSVAATEKTPAVEQAPEEVVAANEKTPAVEQAPEEVVVAAEETPVVEQAAEEVVANEETPVVEQAAEEVAAAEETPVVEQAAEEVAAATEETPVVEQATEFAPIASLPVEQEIDVAGGIN